MQKYINKRIWKTVEFTRGIERHGKHNISYEFTRRENYPVKSYGGREPNIKARAA